MNPELKLLHEKIMKKRIYNDTLNNSMGTQFGSLPKLKFKDMIKQPRLARITAQLEMNDHDGYCSDDDCEYTKQIIKVNVIVPEKYKEHPVGKIDDTNEHKWAYHHMWAKYLPLPEVNICGSGYCKFHNPKGGVGQHQYRYTIKKVEIIANKKYKNKNGYLVMASIGDYSDYENEPYGISKTLTEAKVMAKEAVTVGSKRDSKWRSIPLTDWTGEKLTQEEICKRKKFDRASIINLDNMQGCLFCYDCYPEYVYREIDKNKYKF